jgi:hypothetical protein
MSNCKTSTEFRLDGCIVDRFRTNPGTIETDAWWKRDPIPNSGNIIQQACKFEGKPNYVEAQLINQGCTDCISQGKKLFLKC